MAENKIYKRFHVVDDIKHILLHNLSRLNCLQSQAYFIHTDLQENKIYYNHVQREEAEFKWMEIQAEIQDAASRCLNDTELLIIEIQNIIDLYQTLSDTTEIQSVIEQKFSPFIHGISGLDTLFQSKLNPVQELLFKIKLFGKTLQKMIHFEIEIEIK